MGFAFRRPISGRRALPALDPPGENLELVCRYRLVDRVGDLELLKATNNRCGRPRTISSEEVRLGERIDVPEDGPTRLVVARFSGLGDSPIHKLTAGLYRGSAFRFTAGDIDHRFVAGTQSSWHVIQAPDCVDLGSTGAQIDTFALDMPGRILPDASTYMAEFASIEFDCSRDD